MEAQSQTIDRLNASLADVELGIVRRTLEFQEKIHEAFDAKADSLSETVYQEMMSDMEVPTDSAEAFDMLWDIAADMVDDPEEYEDAITMFASYFAEMGGEHLKEVASSGIAAIDADFAKELLVALEYDPEEDLEDAIANLVDLASASLAEED